MSIEQPPVSVFPSNRIHAYMHLPTRSVLSGLPANMSPRHYIEAPCYFGIFPNSDRSVCRMHNAAVSDAVRRRDKTSWSVIRLSRMTNRLVFTAVTSVSIYRSLVAVGGLLHGWQRSARQVIQRMTSDVNSSITRDRLTNDRADASLMEAAD